MNTRHLRRRLANGDAVVGMLVAYNAPWLIEVCGLSGYDFAVLDLEHEAFNDESVANLIRAADSVGLPLLVRMDASERVVPFLSAGVAGVWIPHLRDRKHAEEIVRLTRFRPRGRRTYYTQTRAAQYGIGIDDRTWLAETEEELIVVVMLEDVDVIQQLDELLTVPGIDGFHLGMFDLAESMHRPPVEELETVIDDAVRRCVAADKFAGVGVITPWNLESVKQRVDQGVQVFTIASAWLLTSAVSTVLGEVHSRLPHTDADRLSATLVPPNVYLGGQGDR